MTTTESLDMIHMFYGIRQMYMQVWETAEKRFSMGVPVQELFDWCKHEYAEKDTFLERVIEDFKQVYSAQSDLQPTCNQLATDCISRQVAIDAVNTALFPKINTAKDAEKALRELPSAQPEIIRCKDCKHYKFADNRAFGFPVRRCEWTGFEDVDDDDFCSRAERREE